MNAVADATEQADVRAEGPPTVELVGAAGAGKTTLLRELAARTTLHPAPVLSHVELAACLLLTAPLLATLTTQRRGGRWLTRDELRSMLYLRGWRQQLRRAAPRATVVLDHGPVYRLAWLSEFGPPLRDTPVYRRWWRRSLRQWATTLDWIVWLQAPTPLLLQRVRTRGDRHLIKHRPEDRAERFLIRYQDAYRRVIDEIGAVVDGPRLLCLDSDADPPARLAEQVLASLAAGRAGERRG